MRSPERKVLIPWMIGAVLTSLILTGVSTAVYTFIFEFSAFFTGIYLLILTAIFGVYTLLRFRAWGFEMREDYLYLERGVLKKVRSKVPYVRVQHVDTQRGPVYRFFGLSKLVVYTAGSRGADVGIPGLLPGDADEIQEELRKVAVESEEEFGDAV